jgi:integrase
MYSVNLVIKKNYVMADGTTHIYIQYSLTRENRRLIKTGKKIQPEFWDQSSEKVKRNFEHAGEYNSVLNLLKHRLENIIDTAILQGDVVTLDYVEKKFYNKCGTQSPKEKDFFALLDEYLQSKVGQVSKDVVKDYYTLMKHLKGFQEHSGETIRFNKIDLKFYENFVRYLEFTVVKKNGEVGMQKNSVGKLIKNLKCFLNNSMRKKLIEPIDLTSFKTTTAQVDDIYLTEQELENIEKLDLTNNPFLSKIRDMFLIGCETGLRYSDLNRLDWQHIEGNFIQIKVKKTTSRVIIPISTRVRRILESYLMPDFPSGIHMNYFNPEIKNIAFLAGINTKFSKWKIIGNQKTEITKSKHLFVSSHTCRRTFCTNQFLRGMPPILIRKISGHKDETSFLKYIKIDEEEAAQKMLDIWGA